MFAMAARRPDPRAPLVRIEPLQGMGSPKPAWKRGPDKSRYSPSMHVANA
jgi:hypothetical protein